MKIDPESWPILSRLLDQWLDLPEESRAAWLESLGPEHASILPMLRKLMLSEEGAADRRLNTLPKMNQPAGHIFASGSLVGPYRLVRELGQGGMGVVWLAERADGEVKRQVALKLPIVSLHNPALAERFARERDILAQLTHPHIARLYDAGVADRGQPYLAIEYVEGEKITAYCERNSLGVAPRLQLFLQVLHAVQYAHANLIVHRDLKPANILVTNEGDVRLLDFGIAKLLTEGEARETELTRIGGRALTPDYASPEQIAGNTITTASDVYSLGVILYELLTGERPYKLKRDTRSSLEEAILNSDAIRPSQTAKDRKLARALKGDLDCIALKALAKEPQERYLTAEAFAQDIENYLQGETVRAQPKSAWYRAGKFVRRNKLAVGSAAAIAAALSLGISIALWQAHVARVKSRTAEAVQAFLLEIFQSNSSQQADPMKARQTTARELLDIGTKKIDGALNDVPEAKVEVLHTLSDLHRGLGLTNEAVALGRKQVQLAKSIYGPFHPEVALALVELGLTMKESPAGKDEEELVLREAETILDRNRDFTSVIRARFYLSMASHYQALDLGKSVDYAERVVRIYRSLPPSSFLVDAWNILGQAQSSRKNYRQAVAAFSQGVSLAKSLQDESKGLLPAMYAYLGEARYNLMEIGAAEQSFRLAMETARSLYGEDHEDMIQTRGRLGIFLFDTARSQEGLTLLKEAVDLAIRTRGPEDFFHTGQMLSSYGHRLILYGRVEEGVASLVQATENRRRAKRSANRSFARGLDSLALGQIALGHYREAEAVMDEASQSHARIGDTASSGLLNTTLFARAGLLLAQGAPEKALTTLRTIPVKANGAVPISSSWLEFSVAYAAAELAGRQYDAGIRRANEARKQIEGSGQRPYLKRYEAQSALAEGKGLLLTQRAPDALPLLQRAVQLGPEVYDRERSPDLADSQIALASCFLDLGRRDQARALLAQVKAIHSTHKELSEQFKKPLRQLEARLAPDSLLQRKGK